MDINKLQTDSRKVKPGDIFIALKGISSDGHDYIDLAIENGASKIIASINRDYSNNSIIEYVEDTQDYLYKMLETEYLPKINNLIIVGLTGTNGKTTTCYLVYQMLLNLGVNAAYLGTIGLYYQDKIKELNNTTPEVLELYKLLIELVNNGVTHLVMEVSSHALEQDRVHGIKFAVAGFTNMTQDHLDYHITMDNYLNAKLKIFNYFKDNTKIVVNTDDEYAKHFLKNNYLSIGMNDSDIKILKSDFIDNKTNINFYYNNKEYNVETNLMSSFNVYNYLVALGILISLNYNIDDVLKITKSIQPPKGRVETIKLKTGTAVIDYAHTPDAVLKIISAFKQNANGKIYTVIGCGGDRDPAKRPIMGKISTDSSDYVIFTDDNPRTEDPAKIMDDIISSLSKNNYIIEHDRHLAIKKGLDMLNENDVLLILGKGHEEYQITNAGKRHFSDLEEVNKYIIANK